MNAAGIVKEFDELKQEISRIKNFCDDTHAKLVKAHELLDKRAQYLEGAVRTIERLTKDNEQR